MNLEINNMEMAVTNVNTTTETHGQEQVLATDISLRANLPVEDLEKFSESDENWAKKWEDLLWNEQGEVTGHCLKHLGFDHEYKDHLLHIMDEDEETMEFVGVKINKFQAEPLPGKRINLSFQVRVHPSKQQNGELTALQKTDTEVQIIKSPQEELAL